MERRAAFGLPGIVLLWVRLKNGKTDPCTTAQFAV